MFIEFLVTMFTERWFEGNIPITLIMDTMRLEINMVIKNKDVNFYLKDVKFRNEIYKPNILFYNTSRFSGTSKEQDDEI